MSISLIFFERVISSLMKLDTFDMFDMLDVTFDVLKLLLVV